MYDFEHKVLEANSAAEKYLGKSPNTLLNSFVEDNFEHAHRGAIETVLKKISRREKEEDHLIISTGGKILDFHFSVFEEEQNDSRPGGMILIYDLTQQKSAEEKLAKRVKELKVLNEIAQLLNSSLSEDVIFSALIEKSVEVLAAEAGTIALYERNDFYSRDLIFNSGINKMN